VELAQRVAREGRDGGDDAFDGGGRDELDGGGEEKRRKREGRTWWSQFRQA